MTQTLQDRWPLGDISFGVFFFVLGQVILYAFSDKICDAVSHYVDGLFFATICNLLAIMMVYKVCHFPPANLTQCVMSRARTNQLTARSAVLGFHHQGRPRILGWN